MESTDMMIFNKNKAKLAQKNKENSGSDKPADPKNSLKTEIMKSLLKRKTDDNEANSNENIAIIKEKVTKIDDSIDTDKILSLIKKINSSKEKMIAPKIDISSGKIVYPLLTEINEDEENIEFLEKLSDSTIDVLEKTVYEKFLVCPQHPESLSVNVRLYCPECKSMNIEKLHLFEHTRCGYISEKQSFENSDEKNSIKCPSCNKVISDFKKELKVPAMWYLCNHCNEKFDDVLVKLHCRNHNHDFETNQSHMINIPGFKIKSDEGEINIDVSAISNRLNDLLNKYGFEVEENYSIKGKSGHYHHIDLFGENKSGKTIFIFIKKSSNALDNSEINSKIIQVLDTAPTIAILVGFASISEKAKSIATSYNVSIVSDHDTNQIISSTDEVLTKHLSNLGEDE
ncbi:MAG: TackOD1 domain-containing metal-binding protein [Promethearchaeota archaeon]